LKGGGGAWFLPPSQKKNSRTAVEQNIFFLNLTLSYLVKNLSQIIFFSTHPSQIKFVLKIQDQNIFLEKSHGPPSS
jgi:hypothetical protein